MRSKRPEGSVSPGPAAAEADQSESRMSAFEGFVARELERRGVESAWAETIARSLLPLASKRDEADLRALLDGAAAAHAAERGTSEKLQESLSGLRELERWMGHFAGELSKLDEALEVLAAYVRRMRTSSRGEREESGTLH